MAIKINQDDDKKKEPSEKLISLINELVDTGVKFTNVIDKVWEQGAKEGFSREEIADIVRPIARQKGLNKHQVYYLTHKPQMLEKAKEQYQALVESRNIPTFEVPKLELVFEHPEQDSWMYFKRMLCKDSVGILFTYMFKDGTVQRHMCYDHSTNGLLIKFKRHGYIVRYCNGWIAPPKHTIYETCYSCREELKSFEDGHPFHYGLLGCTNCDRIYTDSDKIEPGSLHEREYEKAEGELVKQIENQIKEVLRPNPPKTIEKLNE